MGKGNTNDEITDYFDLDSDRIPSQSAFNQRRSQISLSAFEYLFSEFSSAFPATTNTFKDHCILACDGCHVVYTTNSEIIEDFNKPHLIDYKGYNHMHLNGFVDVISKAFIDVVIQPGQKPDERQALHIMLDHFQPDEPSKYIITADRGYESYDLLFHCELKHLSYVFRVKAPSSPKSILSYYKNDLPDEQDEFDVTIKRFLTDKKTNIMRSQSDVYRYMNPSKNIPHFQQLLNHKHLYFMQFRVIKMKVAEDSYELPMKQYRKTKRRNVVSLTNINMKSIFIRGRSSENRIIKLIAKYIHAVKSEFRQFSRPLRGIGAIHFGYR